MTFYRSVRALLTGYLLVVYRIKIVGKEHVPTSGAFVVAPSHRSMLDIPVIGAITTQRVHFMGKAPLFRVPVLGSLFRALGGFPVERDGTDTKPLRESLRILRSGEPLVVYPEGTRKHGPQIAPLQPGAAYLATKVGVPIVPVGIAGSEEPFRARRGRLPGFGRIVVVIGEPILPAELNGSVAKRAAVDDVTETLRARLQTLFDEAYGLRRGWRATDPAR